MASLPQAKDEKQLKSLTVGKVRDEYLKLGECYNKIIDNKFCYCPKCGKWLSATNFYQNKKNADNLEHWGCKKDIVLGGCDYNKSTNTLIDNKEKAKQMCRVLDWVFVEKDYDDQVKSAIDGLEEKNRSTGWQQYIVMIQSLPQYRDKTFYNSELLESSESDILTNGLSKKAKEEAIRRFGDGYNETDLKFLYIEYKDWVSKYECSTKNMELIFQRIVSVELEIRKAQKSGKSTKDLDKTLQDLMDSGGLKPRQNKLDSFSDAQTFGTLIQKYEETRPLPEIDPELQDVDKIGLYIDAFYRGHASKMLGLKNTFSHLYDKVMSKYTVTQPKYDEETDSEVLFEKIFGSVEDE